MNKEQLEKLYLALLKHPCDSWRIKNQNIYCMVRDAVANVGSGDVQETQEHFESLALTERD
jgi:hypothetical protein